MISFQCIVEEWLNGYDEDALKKLNQWLDDLQEMYEKAEKIDELETTLYTIDELTDEATGVMDQIRGYCNG